MNDELIYNVRSTRKVFPTESWLPTKADSVARVLFSDQSERAADIIFFPEYPRSFRIGIYSPTHHIDFDVSAHSGSGLKIRPTSQTFRCCWTEQVIESLMRTGILRKELELA